MNTLFKTNINLGLLVLRIGVAGLMLLHGIFKITHGVTGIEGFVAKAGLPTFVAYGVFIGEVIAPLFILLGYGTRVAAAVFAFNCLAAAMLTNQLSLSLNAQGGLVSELLALYFIGAVTLVFTGGGKYGLRSNRVWD